MRGRGTFRMPFQPYGMEVLTRFTHGSDSPAPLSDLKDPKSPRVGKLTHPCGARTTTCSPSGRPARCRRPTAAPIPYDDPLDAGHLPHQGRQAGRWSRAQMLLIKNDPKYNEQWPRPLVPYKRIYGVDEPEQLAAAAQRRQAVEAPAEGHAVRPGRHVEPVQARERSRAAWCPKGSVTAVGDPYAAFSHSMSSPYNWGGQGADAGLYENSDIHAIRILAMEPATLPVAGRFYNHACERLRILGEIPVRQVRQGRQAAARPRRQPDTSFLAKIPADVAFTFQTLDKDGMVLNMAQTWHQVRPGEIRNNCGGCHAHSQQPTLFEKTAAAKPDYQVFDLTKQTPLLTAKENDESGSKWDAKDETGLRFEKGVKDVEYHRDIKPIFERSCVACHSSKLDEAGRQAGARRRQAGRGAALGPGQRRARCRRRTTRWPATTSASRATSAASSRGAAC